MAERRKRMKEADYPGFDLSVVDAECQAQQMNGGGSRGRKQELVSYAADNSASDAGCFASRCAVRHVHEVVTKFDESKKDLVRSIGFGGLLQFPVLKQIQRKFSLYVMRHTDHKRCAINIGDRISISFNKFDVCHIFDIPSRGKIVLDDGACSRYAKARVIQNYLGQEFNEKRSVKIVQEIIERQHSDSMTKEEADRFRVAFVVFVVSNLLSPSAKYDYASVDYWNAIEDPDLIGDYDWCGFVITKLLDGVAKLKHDVANNIRYPTISGCVVFLQVLYLDSIDLPGLMMPHNTLPRISVFSCDVISKMVIADSNYIAYCRGAVGEYPGKLRDASRCVYSWAMQVRSEPVDDRNGGLLALWESVVAMVHLLGIPLEAAGPLFVAAADFQDQVNDANCVDGNLAMKFVSVIVSLLIPYSRGFRYTPQQSADAKCNGGNLVESVVQRGMQLLFTPLWQKCENRGKTGAACGTPDCLREKAIENGNSIVASNGGTSGGARHVFVPLRKTCIDGPVARSMQYAFRRESDTPDHMKVDLCVASVMSRFYETLRKMKCPNYPAGRMKPHADWSMVSNHLGHLPGNAADKVIVSPWELGYVWPFELVDSEVFGKNIRAMEERESLAVVHRDPKYVQVSYAELCAQLAGRCEMDLDLFDVLVRVARQEDDSMYKDVGNMRWRLFFESDFMGCIVCGGVDLLDPRISEKIPLQYSNYDISKTELVFFPALLQCKWAVFVWHPLKNVISVFDPISEVIDRGGRFSLIERYAHMLKLLLKTMTGCVFKGASADVSLAQVYIIDIDDRFDGSIGVNRSGVLCSMFYRCFNGSQLILAHEKVGLACIAAVMFEDIRKLCGNCGLHSSGDLRI